MKKRHLFQSLLIVLAMLNLLFCQARAQFQGRIEGVVVDNEGNPVEKAKVTIISVKTSSVTFELSTDKNGNFIQVGLRPGYYQLNIKKPGFMPASREVKVSISEATLLEVRLEKVDAAVERSISEADNLFLKGNKLYEEKKYDEAIASYEAAIKLSPTQWGYYFNLGLSYKKLDEREEAKAAFEKAQELNHESYNANKELAEILAKLGNFDEAKKYYKKATELSLDDPDAFYNLGVCSVNLGESDEAFTAFLKVLELKNDYADAYFQLGTLSISQNKKEEAMKYLEKFLELAPSHEKAGLARQLLEFLKK